MHLVGNKLNDHYPQDLVDLADSDDLEQIDLAVAYVREMGSVFELAERRNVPLRLYALADGYGFPHLDVVRKFLHSRRTVWRLFLTRGQFHPKIMWFRGVGAYIGSANLTQSGWYGNLECGVWVPKADLDHNSWTEELSSMFAVIADQCVEATRNQSTRV